MTIKRTKEADFTKFQFKHGDVVVAPPQGIILGVVIAQLFIRGSGGGVSRAYYVRGCDASAVARFEYELRPYSEWT